MTIQQAFSLAIEHHYAGRLTESESLYRQILADAPDHTEALHAMGVLIHQLGQHVAAENLIRKALELVPRFPEAHINLGNALQAQGRLAEAADAFREAIALKRDSSQAYYNLANALNALGRSREAIEAFRRAIALKPDDAQAHINLGKALADIGEAEQAVAMCHRGVTLNPNLPEGHNNFGLALTAAGQPDRAIAAFRQALTIQPNFPEAYCNLAVALKDLGQLDESIAAGRKAISLKPDYQQAHHNLLLTMLYDPSYDPGTVAGELRSWAAQHADPLTRDVPAYSNRVAPDRRLRIGYVSPYFCNHVVGRNLLPLFRRHNRQQFEVFCYADVIRADELTKEVEHHCDQWRNLAGLSDEQAAAMIRADEVDILVDTALHLAHNRLMVFAQRPAPVQVTFAGYPGSTGLAAIDYRFSDPYLDPPGMDESFYSEKTVCLPDSFWCYDPLECADIPTNPLPAGQAHRITFGCLNNFCKINPPIVSLWAAILRQVPTSRILLMSDEGSARQRMVDRFAKAGIEPSRVAFCGFQPRRRYLQQYHQIDLALDTFPYNGHTTSLDSLWMGVPVVTLVGQAAVSRAGWSALSNLQLTELAATTPQRYVELAVEMANDLPRLESLRSILRQRMQQSALMDAARFAGNIESAYRQMWRRWCESK